MKQEINTYNVNLIEKNQLNISGKGDDVLCQPMRLSAQMEIA